MIRYLERALHHKTTPLLLALGLALTLAGGVLVAHRAQAQGMGPQERALAPQGAVGTAFTYQGRLLDNDIPVDGSCDFRFTLYDDDFFFPGVVGGPLERGSVDVQDGYFSVGLDFGAAAFTGEGRQLGVAVRCPAGSGGYSDLSGLVPLTGAPYAHSLRPGAVVSGNVAGPILSLENTYAGFFAGPGLQVTARDVGVWSSGDYQGVHGETTTASGVGVYGMGPSTGTVGVATAASGVTYGVHGRNASYNGAGVYGTSDYAGGTGVRGTSTDGVGVEGSSGSGTGVVGASTSGRGVWAYSGSDHALWAEGDAHINGALTWLTRTGYVAIHPSACQATNEDIAYGVLTDTAYVIRDNMLTSYDNLPLYFNAPVQLPHGSRVSELTCYWYDTYASSIDVACRLYRADIAGQYTHLMAIADSSGSPGVGSTYTGVITYPMVYNNLYSYYLWVGFSGTSVAWPATPEHGFYGATITYEYARP